MNKKITLALGALALTGAMALTGCTAVGASASGSESVSKPTATETVTPTPEGPVELTVEEAGNRYLDIVCPVNGTTIALSAAFDAGEDAYINGEAPDPAAVKAAAQAKMDATTTEIGLMEDESVLWPSGIKEHLTAFRDHSVAGLATLSAMVNAPTYEAAYHSIWPDSTAAAAASQEVRLALQLSPDTFASCVGHEDGHTRLTAEK